MEIEIVTTKKKLSMSIVKQMKIASYSDIAFALKHRQERVLGYITNFSYKKQITSMVILHGISDWCLYPLCTPCVIEKTSREQHPDGEMYHMIDVVYYTVKQTVGAMSFYSKYDKSREESDRKAANGKEIIRFAKGLHIYL